MEYGGGDSGIQGGQKHQGERGDCELCKCLWFLAILLSHLILFFDSEISLGIVDEGEVSTKQGGVGER